ncbi:MAG: L-glutamate gamma-semialdehyde dehydrogenase, partial [Burkholderiaceae bacterium]|nr:L-glutamate gamma-semialdehyde dehydrogenase [Burkholderiaceae bacterium]
KNSAGVDLSNENVLRKLSASYEQIGRQQWHAMPLLDGPVNAAAAIPVCNPSDRRDVVGTVVEADVEDVETALVAAASYATDWQTREPAARAAILVRAAELFEENQAELMAIAVREAGKSLPNAIAEVREAIDFLHYYAEQIRGTQNALPLGPVVCISPWNFPLAIFTGEVAASLAAGNVVLAKPAEQTPLIAFRAVQLLHEAGIPRAVLQLLPGRGETVGAKLTMDARVRGVIFTGSTEVAQLINRTLAKRSVEENCDIALIAETGGQNAMIVDSSALPEQVVNDVINSAFDSAGQRCSALRILCLQEEIADKTLAMLKGAMQELRLGRPDRLATDIGPVIDAEAQQNLLHHIDRVKARSKSFYQLPLPEGHEHGTYVAPTVVEIASIAELKREVFGPVLHVLRYRRDDLPALLDAINGTGYGLTLGIHSRIDETIDFITARAHVGNIYVNRNIVGAVVGVQPFGGEGKSGTGPKAGGPLYLKRLQRNPALKIGSHTIHQSAAARANMPALDALLDWARTHGHENIAALGEQYLHGSPIDTSLMLPGPTGERNTLSFAARGRVLCEATRIDVLLNQLAAVLATQNTPVVRGANEKLIPYGLPTVVRKAIQVENDLAATALDFALAEGACLRDLRPLLAAREGAIVNVIECQAEQAIPLWRLVAERALCVNTTAAGGNASLMTLGA